MGSVILMNTTDDSKLNDEDIEVILEKIKPTIEYALLQTTSENRDDLRQHLYEKSVKTLKNVRMTSPKGMFL